jgi:DNA-binding NarL/FixJ family response regulator
MQEGVADRAGLAKKLGGRTEQPLNMFEKARQRRQRVEKLLLEGLGYEVIGSRVEVERWMVVEDAKRIYRKHGLKPREGIEALAKKMGVDLGGRFTAKREARKELRERLLAGQSQMEIAWEMGLNYHTVVWRCGQIYREEGVRGRRELVEKMSIKNSELSRQKVETQTSSEFG